MQCLGNAVGGKILLILLGQITSINCGSASIAALRACSHECVVAEPLVGKAVQTCAGYLHILVNPKSRIFYGPN